MLYLRLFIFYAQEKIIKEEEIALIVYMTLVVVLLSTMVILFFIAFQKRKNKLLLDKVRQKQAFDDEITKTQTEIQEQTLKFIGQELHDNVGQLLAYAQMQLGMLKSKVDDDVKDQLKETSKVVSDSLVEVRSLSKSLNSEVLLDMGFIESIRNELARLKRISFSKAELKVVGDIQDVTNRAHELVLFRILQEFLSNSMKYSEADTIQVLLSYDINKIKINAMDDGVGFDLATIKKGSGLINMSSRADLIGASFKLQSRPGEGTEIKMVYPL